MAAQSESERQLLDVGCGPGSITLDLAGLVAPGQVVGIDIQRAQIDQARALASARGVTTVRFEVEDIYELPFSDASFDAALANGVLMHLSEAVRALAELRRVLRPGGVAGVRDPDWGASLRAPRRLCSTSGVPCGYGSGSTTAATRSRAATCAATYWRQGSRVPTVVRRSRVREPRMRPFATPPSSKRSCKASPARCWQRAGWIRRHLMRW